MKFSKAAASLLAGALALGTVGASAETLRLGDFQSTTHIVSIEGTTRWMKAVEEATGGEIEFEHYPSAQAAKAAAQLDAVKAGILDAALIGTPYHSKDLPLNSVVALPGYYSSAVHGTKALQEMLAKGPLRDELLAAEVVPIFGFVLPPYQVLAKKHLGGPGDWTGLDIRTSGSTQAMTARSLGAVGVSIPGPEVYTAVERSRLDGILFPLASVPGYNLQEVVSHISKNGSFGGYSFVMVVQKDRFDGLPETVKTAMLDAGKDIALHVAEAQDASIEKLVDEWTEQELEVYDFTPEELAELNASMAEVSADWVQRVGGGSETAKAVLEDYRKLTSE
ncbi:TRAP transporter substrate-binding protein DctP [Roseibium aggregatum]|uniref:TRAP transporter substrate-binding protein DctP n=1 Tax=Roseibium aggregatum TaxID=187304 RepID=A0A939EA81_9HYPH|nr:TRAP transporter substrate-binding protein DctP [Roseibium aggregatum]MBN9669021.1 TRAP transporter substrate-binding protein DctP [Roseibium aggregatum]